METVRDVLMQLCEMGTTKFYDEMSEDDLKALNFAVNYLLAAFPSFEKRSLPFDCVNDIVKLYVNEFVEF